MTNESSTWVKNTANMTTNIYPIDIDTILGYNGKAALGFDDVTLGWQGAGGPTLKNQTVGGFVTKDFYLGFFGVSRALRTSLILTIPFRASCKIW